MGGKKLLQSQTDLCFILLTKIQSTAEENYFGSSVFFLEEGDCQNSCRDVSVQNEIPRNIDTLQLEPFGCVQANILSTS